MNEGSNQVAPEFYRDGRPAQPGGACLPGRDRGPPAATASIAMRFWVAGPSPSSGSCSVSGAGLAGRARGYPGRSAPICPESSPARSGEDQAFSRHPCRRGRRSPWADGAQPAGLVPGGIQAPALHEMSSMNEPQFRERGRMPSAWPRKARQKPPMAGATDVEQMKVVDARPSRPRANEILPRSSRPSMRSRSRPTSSP